LERHIKYICKLYLGLFFEFNTLFTVCNLNFSSLLGYRDKFFVKVYAAAFYVDYSLGIDTEQWKEKAGIEIYDASSIFDSVFKGNRELAHSKKIKEIIICDNDTTVLCSTGCEVIEYNSC
jgi:hypothetical protein